MDGDFTKYYEEFVELVLTMRQYQKRYFKNKRKDILIASKELEKKVDDWIDRNRFGDQKSLF